MKRTNQLKVLIAAIGAIAATFAAAVRAADDADSKFLQEAIQTDIAEVKMSELALQRSNDSGVRELAHRLQTDHSTSMQQTAALAKTLGVTPPSQASAQALEDYAQLSKLSGQEFDAAFVTHMVAGHREAVGKFGEQTHANPNAAIADLAAKTLPTLKEHLAMAESLLGAGVHPSAEAHGGHSQPPTDFGAVEPQASPSPDVGSPVPQPSSPPR